jgi:hypothetical protein
MDYGDIRGAIIEDMAAMPKVRCFCGAGAPRSPRMCPNCGPRVRAWLAAIETLEAAAPYPDEALVFSMPDGQHVTFAGTQEYRGRVYVRVEDVNWSLSIVTPGKLLPLTPGAVDLLGEIRKGVRP